MFSEVYEIFFSERVEIFPVVLKLMLFSGFKRLFGRGEADIFPEA